MIRLAQRIARFLKAEDGPTAVEYATMLMLVVLACISAVVSVGQATDASLRNSCQEISDSLGPRP